MEGTNKGALKSPPVIEQLASDAGGGIAHALGGVGGRD